MQLLQHEQLWALAHARQEEMLRAAEKARLLRSIADQQPGIWQRLWPRRVEQQAAYRPEPAPKLARPA